MATYNLSALIDWSRRAAGDRLQVTTEQLSSDGTATTTLENDGEIEILSITIDDTPTTAFVLNNNVITFTSAPTLGATLVIQYEYTEYSDNEILDFLSDGAQSVASDINGDWTVNNGVVTDTGEKFIVNNIPDPRVIKLVVLQTAMGLRQDKANAAADDAIFVKDGDTTIDTSRGANSNEKVMQRLMINYDAERDRVASNLFKGTTC